MSNRVEEHGTPSVYEPKDYVDIVEDDDDELSDEEGMTPEHTDDELSQAQSSGGRQNAEQFPSRGPQVPTQASVPKNAPTKPPVQPVVRGKTPNPTRVPNPDKYATSSKDKKSNGGK